METKIGISWNNILTLEDYIEIDYDVIKLIEVNCAFFILRINLHCKQFLF